MGQEDLQLLLVQKPDDKLDLLIYDPMPGGSGLLEQMLSRWQELIATARELPRGLGTPASGPSATSSIARCSTGTRPRSYWTTWTTSRSITGTSCRCSRKSSPEAAPRRTSQRPASRPSCTNTISRRANA